MRVSVCMGTYNGGSYIREQLDCIWRQSVQPDEVIICDDGSTDDTIDIIEKFIQDKRLQGTWKLYCNEQNKGYPANFYFAMSLCTGDIVFLGDQDDVWEKHKIEKMVAVLKAHEDARVVACKFGLINSNGNSIHTFMAPSHTGNTGKVFKVNLDNIFYKYEWPGMVLAYRRKWYQNWSAGQYKIPHDLLITARAAEEGVFLQLDEELAWHRRHDHNAAKEEHRIRKLLNKERKIKEIESYCQHLEGFQQGNVLQTDIGRRTLQKKQKAMQDRYNALKSGSIRQVLMSARDNKEGLRLATIICDVLIVKKRR